MISVVATLFRSESYIREFYQRCLKELHKLGHEYEFVFVDDGSPDDSLGVVLELMQEDSAVRAIELSRNFGHHKAMMTGLQHARGEFVFLIDVDLEEPPECLELLWQQLLSSRADVSFGVQSKRQGPLSGRILGELYYTIYNWISRSPMPRNQLTARLMRREYVQALLEYREHRFAIEAIWHLAGFHQVPVAINKAAHKGSSSYTLSHKLRLFLDSITSTSALPLVFISYAGLALTIPCGIYILWVLFQSFFLGVSVDGWTSLIVSIWFMGGFIIFNLGVVSTYLSVIFTEVKQRPYTIVRKVHERNVNDENEPDDPSRRTLSTRLASQSKWR
jgi:putative glycosyltransferase